MSNIPKIQEAYPALPAGYTEVQEGHWEMTSLSDDKGPLGTLAVSSCSVIAVRNLETARAYLGHFFQPHSRYEGNREEFDAMIEAIIQEKEDSAHGFEAWVSGASLFENPSSETHQIHNAEVMASRGYVLDGLKRLGNGTIILADWLGDNEALAAVTFDPTGNPAIEYLKEKREADDFGGGDDGKKNPPQDGLKNLTGIISRSLSPPDKRQLEEVSRDGLLDQLNQAAPESATIPSRLLPEDS